MSNALYKTRFRFAAAGYPFPLEKSPRPFGEVLSYEFWVLSSLAHYEMWGKG